MRVGKELLDRRRRLTGTRVDERLRILEDSRELNVREQRTEVANRIVAVGRPSRLLNGVCRVGRRGLATGRHRQRRDDTDEGSHRNTIHRTAIVLARTTDAPKFKRRSLLASTVPVGTAVVPMVRSATFSALGAGIARLTLTRIAVETTNSSAAKCRKLIPAIQAQMLPGGRCRFPKLEPKPQRPEDESAQQRRDRAPVRSAACSRHRRGSRPRSAARCTPARSADRCRAAARCTS